MGGRQVLILGSVVIGSWIPLMHCYAIVLVVNLNGATRIKQLDLFTDIGIGNTVIVFIRSQHNMTIAIDGGKRLIADLKTFNRKGLQLLAFIFHKELITGEWPAGKLTSVMIL